MPTINFYVATSYGNQRIYLSDDSQASLIATLTRRKTVEHEDLEALKALGFELKQVENPNNVIKL
jgi:Holliday junction resolvasome RuvABC DNA-binding subunit